MSTVEEIFIRVAELKMPPHVKYAIVGINDDNFLIKMFGHCETAADFMEAYEDLYECY